jgi:hypothetical protein
MGFFLSSEGYIAMKNLHKPIQILMALALVMSLFAPLTLTTRAYSASVQPVLAELAAETPNELVRVIVQKTGASNRAEHLVAGLGVPSFWTCR